MYTVNSLRSLVFFVTLTAVTLTAGSSAANSADDIAAQYRQQGETLITNADKALARSDLTAEEKLYLAEMKYWGAVCRFGADDKTFNADIEPVISSLQKIPEAAQQYQTIIIWMLHREQEAFRQMHRADAFRDFVRFRNKYIPLISGISEGVSADFYIMAELMNTAASLDSDGSAGLVLSTAEQIKTKYSPLDRGNLEIVHRVQMPEKEMVFDGTSTDGQFIDIKDFRGKTVVIPFFSPALETYNPLLKKLSSILRDTDCVFINYAGDGNAKDIGQFVTKNKCPGITVCRQESSNDYGRTYGSYRALFLVGQDGKVIKTYSAGLCQGVCEELKKIFPDKTEPLTQLAAEIEQTEMKPAHSDALLHKPPAKQLLSLLDKLQAAYHLLLPESSRLEDVLNLTNQMLTLPDLTEQEKTFVTVQRIEMLATAAVLAIQEQPEVNPAKLYADVEQAISEAAAEGIRNEKTFSIELNLLYPMLEFLKHTPDKGEIVKEIQSRYIKLLTASAEGKDGVRTGSVSPPLNFAIDFTRTLQELRWEGALTAGIGFLEAVIPLIEERDEQPAAETLTKIKRRFLLTGKPFELEGILLNGEEISVADFKGKVVLVDFWATWCPSCRGSFPNKVIQYEKYKDKGFEVVAYSVDANVDALRKYQEQHKFQWKNVSAVLSAEKGFKDYEKFYGIWGIPTTYLLDRTGKVVFMQVESNNGKLNEALQKIFGE